MKIFKTIDEKFAEIGFVKIKEDKFGAVYDRVINQYGWDCVYGYIQRLNLLHKANGRHLVQSYDPHLMDREKIGNTCVGLTMYEMKLCLKKMKQMGWKPCKRKVGKHER